jgi:hypothetical protein
VTVRRPGLFNEGLAGFYRGTSEAARARASRASDETDETDDALDHAAERPALTTKEDR